MRFIPHKFNSKLLLKYISFLHFLATLSYHLLNSNLYVKYQSLYISNTTTNQAHFYIKPRSRFFEYATRFLELLNFSQNLIRTTTLLHDFFYVVLSLLTLAPLLLLLNSTKYFLLNLLEVRVLSSVTLARHALVAAPVICTLFFYLLLLV